MNYNRSLYTNRAERRKNGITSTGITKYSSEELQAIIRKELSNLIDSPCSERLKRERYAKIEPLIDEYKKSKEAISKTQTKTAYDAYQEEKAKIAYNPVYRKLNSNNVATVRKIQNVYGTSKSYTSQRNINGSRSTVSRTQKYTTKKAINAYETQVKYSEKINSKRTIKKPEYIPATEKKKGFFYSMFRAKRKQNKTKSSRLVVYTNSRNYSQNNRKVIRNTSRNSSQRKLRNEYMTDFERRIRYNVRDSKPLPYTYVRNGRAVKYEPRYL